MSLMCDVSMNVQRILHDDSAFVEDLLTAYQSELFAYLMQRCGHREDAEDAMQDMHESMIRYFESFRGDSSVRSWLYTLARSACSKMRRGRKNDPRLHLSLDASVDMAEEEPLRSFASLLDEEVLSLREVFGALTPEQRKVVLLRDEQGYSTRETAELLALSEEAVKTRLSRARKVMRTLLCE